MRAVLLTGFGGYDRLELRDDVPVSAPAAGEVLIKVGAAGVNNTDINSRIGWYSKAVTGATEAGGAGGFAEAEGEGWSGSAFSFPRIQGIDCCGRIVAVGDAVDRGRIGERVLVDPLIRDSSGALGYFGSEYDGAFAEFTRVPSGNALAIESSLSDIELASFPCAYSTAENILTRIGLVSGERVLVTGASGGVGTAAVQLAKRRGAHVTAIAGSGKGEALLRLGADRVVAREADLKALIGTEQIDAVVDVVGGAQFPALLDCLRRGGRYGVSGAIAGPIVELDLRTLYLKDLRLIGCTIPEPEVFPNLVRYIEQGEIGPVIDATFPLTDIVAAQQRFNEKNHVGKIVLTI
jgi:NADPH:quinone reductase-like Zn-dependent oxidoreductase